MPGSKVHLILVIVGAASLTSCNSAKFSAKQSQLQKSIMRDAAGSLSQIDGPGNGIKNTDGASGLLNQNGGDGAAGNISQPPLGGNPTGGVVSQPRTGGTDPFSGGLRQRDGTDDEIDLRLICSDRLSQEFQNYKAAVANNLPLVLAVDGKVCTENRTEIQAIVDKRNFTLADAKRICPDLVPASGKWSSVELIVNKVSHPAKRGVIELLYARNGDTSVDAEKADEACDERQSPLVIHVASDVNNPQPVSLSSPELGVDFDIMGASNNHNLIRISWFTNHDYRLLALPDQQGRVNSVDQLFGNNTQGPDGFYADDGYAALAKYDGTTSDGYFRLTSADGYITPSDAVWPKLRVWLDSNFDGQAQPRELSRLSQVRLAYIDLTFSTDYAEMDQYGNQTKMKSVVGYTDGTLDLIFDLWFYIRSED